MEQKQGCPLKFSSIQLKKLANALFRTQDPLAYITLQLDIIVNRQIIQKSIDYIANNNDEIWPINSENSEII
jgi:hypothetical protein